MNGTYNNYFKRDLFATKYQSKMQHSLCSVVQLLLMFSTHIYFSVKLIKLIESSSQLFLRA
jgi:hypothetical protein